MRNATEEEQSAKRRWKTLTLSRTTNGKERERRARDETRIHVPNSRVRVDLQVEQQDPAGRREVEVAEIDPQEHGLDGALPEILAGARVGVGAPQRGRDVRLARQRRRDGHTDGADHRRRDRDRLFRVAGRCRHVVVVRQPREAVGGSSCARQ